MLRLGTLVSPQGPSKLSAPSDVERMLVCRTVTQALFRQLAESADPILNRKHGILTIYCCLRVGGQFQSVADEEVRIASCLARIPVSKLH